MSKRATDLKTDDSRDADRPFVLADDDLRRVQGARSEREADGFAPPRRDGGSDQVIILDPVA